MCENVLIIDVVVSSTPYQCVLPLYLREDTVLCHFRKCCEVKLIPFYHHYIIEFDINFAAFFVGTMRSA